MASQSQRSANTAGRFPRRDFVPADCRIAYESLRDSLTSQLQPAPGLESVLTREIISASWRLERCAHVEADLEFSTDCEQNEPKYAAVNRARIAASRILWRSTSELRKLQSERCIRQELELEDDQGISDTAEVFKGMSASAKHGKLLDQRAQADFEKFLQGDDELEQDFEEGTHQMAEMLEKTKRTQIEQNVPCSCGSGAKHKSCCAAKSSSPSPARNHDSTKRR